ncbi:hypothetical protein [Nonomuraea insulae]|uniref:HEAT repeat domain-containing protein n=1 Tax=Nonomuraea insulae TaxID=1616787 RepID=A0ABW1CP65_9ACTN
MADTVMVRDPLSGGVAVRRLDDAGRLDRAVVIDAVVGRLLCPGAPVELVRLHDRLDLSLDESAACAGAYARLVPAGPVEAASLAVAQLWRLEEAGLLGEELFAGVLRALASRPERKLLRDALSWAGDAVLRDAGRADAVLEAMALIFGQDTVALQERAVRLAVSLAPQAGPAGREAVLRAAAALPLELREKVATVFGR